MPTGYTADVADGKVTDLRTFALRCARNFGATVMQRDEPMDVLPRPREVSSYYVERLDATRAEASRLAELTDAEWEAEHAEYCERTADSYTERLNRSREIEARYRRMIAEVETWTPPTPDHTELKDFMLRQLRESIGWDVHTPEFAPPLPIAEWRAHRLMVSARDVESALQSLEEERERVKGANEWIKALYDSLPASAAEPAA